MCLDLDEVHAFKSQKLSSKVINNIVNVIIVEISINFQKNISFISEITANFYIPFKSR